MARCCRWGRFTTPIISIRRCSANSCAITPKASPSLTPRSRARCATRPAATLRRYGLKAARPSRAISSSTPAVSPSASSLGKWARAGSLTPKNCRSIAPCRSGLRSSPAKKSPITLWRKRLTPDGCGKRRRSLVLAAAMSIPTNSKLPRRPSKKSKRILAAPSTSAAPLASRSGGWRRRGSPIALPSAYRKAS